MQTCNSRLLLLLPHLLLLRLLQLLLRLLHLRLLLHIAVYWLFASSAVNWATEVTKGMANVCSMAQKRPKYCCVGAAHAQAFEQGYHVGIGDRHTHTGWTCCLLHPLQRFNFHNCYCPCIKLMKRIPASLFALILRGIHILPMSIVFLTLSPPSASALSPQSAAES